MATDVIIPMLLFLSHVVVFALGFGAGRYIALNSRHQG
jgi:hypothetical protein